MGEEGGGERVKEMVTKALNVRILVNLCLH